MLGALIVLSAPLVVLADRKLTVVNQCDETIWPAFFSSANGPANTPTGWEAPPGDSRTITLPTAWNGRLWARTDCDFSGPNPDAPESCSTGGCGGGIDCVTPEGTSTTGVPPATLAEWNLDQGVDWFDVSLVDGFNLPMSVTNSGDCEVPTCPTDINANCPGELQVKNSAGEVVGCNTDCNLDTGRIGNSPYCCNGQYGTPDTCPRTGIPHYSTFKDACPNAYAYAYDENSSSGALWTCDSSKAVDYTVTFCPSSGGSSAQGGNSAQAASAAPVAVASGTSSPPVLVAEPSPAPAEGAVGGCAASPAVSSPAVARRMEPRHKSSDRFTHHQ